MSAIRALLAISSVAVSGAAGCAQPGVVEVNPMNPPSSGAQDAGMVVTQDASMVVVLDSGPVVAQDSGSVVVPDSGPVAQDSGLVVVADSGMVEQDAGMVEVDSGPPPLPPCPSGWMCQDPAGPLADMGLTGKVTGPDGNPVTVACGNGGQVDCKPEDPKGSCPAELTNPICVHVVIDFPPWISTTAPRLASPEPTIADRTGPRPWTGCASASSLPNNVLLVIACEG